MGGVPPPLQKKVWVGEHQPDPPQNRFFLKKNKKEACPKITEAVVCSRQGGALQQMWNPFSLGLGGTVCPLINTNHTFFE
jgi:hypothetical protein